MMSDAITPGTQPQRVSKKTSSKDPQPLSKTDKGGKRIQTRAREKLIIYLFAYKGLKN
jgi:hypothetical protein